MWDVRCGMWDVGCEMWYYAICAMEERRKEGVRACTCARSRSRWVGDNLSTIINFV